MDGGVICVIVMTVETQDSVELFPLLAADGDSAGPSTAHTVPGQTETLSSEFNVILVIIIFKHFFCMHTWMYFEHMVRLQGMNPLGG